MNLATHLAAFIAKTTEPSDFVFCELMTVGTENES
jgi:hypothetical protein